MGDVIQLPQRPPDDPRRNHPSMAGQRRYEQGRQEERDAVADYLHRCGLTDAADAVTRGDHLPDPPPPRAQ